MPRPIATFAGVDIPVLTSVEVSREFIGDRGRTASGRLRQDAVAVKREWRLKTMPVTKAAADDLLTALESVIWGEGVFHLDEFGAGNSVLALIPAESVRETRVQFRDRDGWQTDGREIELTVVEV